LLRTRWLERCVRPRALSVPPSYVGTRQLHRLPVRQRIIYKLAIITYKTTSTKTPAYLSHTIHDYHPARTLRSTATASASSSTADSPWPIMWLQSVAPVVAAAALCRSIALSRGSQDGSPRVHFVPPGLLQFSIDRCRRLQSVQNAAARYSYRHSAM